MIRASMLGTIGIPTEELIQNVKDLRANNCSCIRYQLVNPQEQFEGIPMSTEEQQAWFDQHVFNIKAILATVRIKVIIDFHTPPGGIDLTSPGSYHRLFLPGGLAYTQIFMQQWQTLAAIQSPRIAAYDIFNEPAGPAIAVYALQDSIGAQIRNIAPATRPLIISTPYGAANQTPKKSALKNVWYTAHIYPDAAYSDANATPSMVPGAIFDGLTHDLRKFAKEVSAPIFIGETGCFRWAGKGKNQENWLKSIIPWCEKRGLNWCFHAWREADNWDIEIPTDQAVNGPRGVTSRLLYMRSAWKTGL